MKAAIQRLKCLNFGMRTATLRKKHNSGFQRKSELTYNMHLTY